MMLFQPGLPASGNATPGLRGSLVQQRIELRPDLVFLGTAKVAGVAACCDFAGRGFWLMMIEIDVGPPSRIGKTSSILDGHIGAIESPGKKAPSGGLHTRTIGILRRQRKLQLLENDCLIGELVRP